MICDWNPPPASERRCLRTGRLTALLALVLPCLLSVCPVSGATTILPPVIRRAPLIALAGPGTVGAREQDWLQEDRVWLAVQGAAAGITVVPADTLKGGDDPAAVLGAQTALRRRLAAVVFARGDTIGPLRDRAGALRDRWLARGYLQANVLARGDSLLVTPGIAWSMGPWQVGGDEFTGRARLLTDWLPAAGTRFDAAAVDNGARRLLEAVGELGYPFPRWVVSDLRLDTTTRTVAIAASLLPGSAARIGPVTTDLDDPRAARFLVRASGLARGAPLRGSDLGRAVERLWARDLYAEVDTPRVYTTTAPDTVGVRIRARLRPRPNRLQVVLGVSRRADDARARLSGEVDLRLPNLASSGRSLHVGWRDDGAGQSRFGFSWLEPLAFGMPLDVALGVDSEVQEALYTRFTTDLGARLPVVALWGVEMGVGRDRSTYPVGAIARSERTRARAAVVHRRGDRSRSGWESGFAVESAWRSSQAREGEVGAASLAAAVRQQLLSGDAAGEVWLGRRASLAARLAYRSLSGGEREAPLSEHFRFGGAASVRGYAEGAFHGVEAAWGSLEWRVGSPRGSRLYTFWDLGYFEFWSTDSGDGADAGRHRGWPHGFGLGLLARTPGGDLSLAVGFPGTVDFDLAKLHVTLLESF